MCSHTQPGPAWLFAVPCPVPVMASCFSPTVCCCTPFPVPGGFPRWGWLEFLRERGGPCRARCWSRCQAPRPCRAQEPACAAHSSCIPALPGNQSPRGTAGLCPQFPGSGNSPALSSGAPRSQNQRMVWVGRNLKAHLVQTPKSWMFHMLGISAMVTDNVQNC